MATINATGLTKLATATNTIPAGVAANLVFVHGLGGHPKKTWEYKGRPEETGGQRSLFSSRLLLRDTVPQTPTQNIIWPVDLLPSDIPTANIFAYGYNAAISAGLFQAVNQNTVSQHAQDMAIALWRDLPKTGPIIFVAHSLGGIIVKDALYRSKMSIEQELHSIHRRTRHIIFLGTPHRGSEVVPWATIIARMAEVSFQDINRNLLRTLSVNGEVLSNIHSNFTGMLRTGDFSIHSFREGRGIGGLRGFNGKVVEDFSSALSYGLQETIDANHVTMTKFSSPLDDGYRKIRGVLANWLENITLRSVQQLLPLPVEPTTQTNTSTSPTVPQAKDPPSHSDSAEGSTNSGDNNEPRMGPFHLIAASQGDGGDSLDMISRLVNTRRDINELGGPTHAPAISFAVCKRKPQILKHLLQCGALPNIVDNVGQAPIWYAAHMGFADCMEILLQYGADVNAGDPTALMAAATEGHVDIVAELLKRGANTEVANENLNTSLHMAIVKRHVKTARVLIAGGANVHARTIHGMTPLLLAINFDVNDIILDLLQAGARVNEQDNELRTPVMTAAARGNVISVQLLLDAGADPDIISNHGASAFIAAKHEGHDEVYRVLLGRSQEVRAG